MGVAAVSMAAAFTACDKCADNSCKTATDSVSTAYGDYVGSMINADFARFQDNEKSDKEAFLRGMQIVFGADNSQNSQWVCRLLSRCRQSSLKWKSKASRSTVWP